MRSLTLIAWLSLLLGIAAWTGVVFFYNDIHDKETARVERLREVEQSDLQQASAARMKSLVNDTKAQRLALDELTSTDALTVVKMVESVGKPLGLMVHIDSISPGNPAKNSSLRTLSFSLTADGSYASLMRLVDLYGSFPLPSALERISLHWQGNGAKPDAKAAWHLELHLHVLTSANITS